MRLVRFIPVLTLAAMLAFSADAQQNTGGGGSGGGGGVVTQATGTNLHMVCDSGCSSSTAPADEAAFTFGTTSHSPVGGVFQTTATSNALTTGQMGAFQVTANRALFVDLRNAAGAEVGVAAVPLQVSLANTAANGTAIAVSLAANQTINEAQINGVVPLMGNGVSGTGSQRVNIASDNTAFTVNAAQSGTWTNTVTQATGTNLHIVCDSGCSSSTAPADEAAFTFGTTSQTPIGGVFQTTATSNALTTGQMGAFQVTANRALFTNLRTAAGVETGIAAAPLQVSLANTAANGTAVSVSLAANQSVNEAQINGVVPLMGNGVTGTGSQRVTIASDNTAFSVNAVQSGSWSLAANQSVNVAQMNGVTTLMGAGATGTGAQRVTASQDTTTIAGSAPGTAGSASANVVTVQGVASMTKLLVTPDANAAVNVAQMNGVTTLMGAGATGTGAQRVTVSQDTTTIAGSAPGTAGSASANVLTVQGAASMTPVLASQQPTTAGGLSMFRELVPANTTSVAIKASAGQLYSIDAFSIHATAPIYIRFYNTAQASVTCGTTATVFGPFVVPASGGAAGSGFTLHDMNGFAFSTALTMCVTGGIADADTTSPTASSYSINIGYK